MCDKVVCETMICVTKLCVKKGIREKMVFDKGVCVCVCEFNPVPEGGWLFVLRFLWPMIKTGGLPDL